MPEWWIERGIGETRAVLVEQGRIIEARIDREGTVRAGTVLAARLKTTGRNAIAIADDGEYLLPKGAPGVTEGAALSIEVTREAIGGPEPWKRPLARLSHEAPRAAEPLDGDLLPCPDPSDRLGRVGWDDLIDEARSGIVGFDGGELRMAVTPAMTLIDVDGRLPPAELALAGARAAALAIRRHAISGSIGIDLPTVAGKAARSAPGDAIDAVLPPPFERTAVNGFGFLQIVRPRARASLIELATDRPVFEARALLRRAGREVGALTLVANPKVIAAIEANPGWVERLSRQVGGAVGLRADPKRAIEAGDAVQA